MVTVLFDRETKRVTGFDREPEPFELSVANVKIESLRKIDVETEVTPETDSEGNPLFKLPAYKSVKTKVETTEKTSEPVMVEEEREVPLLDSKGNVVKYNTGYTYFDEETKKEVRVEGREIECSKRITVEVKKTNENGEILYYKTATKQVPDDTKPVEKITQSDSRYTPDLEPSYITKEKTLDVTFETQPERFTYADVIAHKEKQLVDGVAFVFAQIFANTEGLYVDKKADIGVDFVSIPPKGYVVTRELRLPNKYTYVKIELDKPSKDLLIEVNGEPVDQFNEIEFLTNPVDLIKVKITNNGTKPVEYSTLTVLA